MGVLGPIVQIPVLAVFDTGQDFPLRGTIARQFVRDAHPGHVLAPLQQLEEEPLRRFFVPATLDEDVKYLALLIDRPPQVVPCAIDREEDFI